jgi:hypothetical protein
MATSHTSQRRVVHWRAPEFLYREKTPIWYTHVSLFFFTVLLVLFLISNYLGAVVVLLAAWVFLSLSNERPKTVEYAIDRKGIKIGDRTIAFREVDSFSANLNSRHPVIYLDLSYPFALPVTMVVKPAELDAVMTILLDYIPMRNHNSLLSWVSQLLHY